MISDFWAWFNGLAETDPTKRFLIFFVFVCIVWLVPAFIISYPLSGIISTLILLAVVSTKIFTGH